MTDAEHAAVLRRRQSLFTEWIPPDEQAAIERAIELLDQQPKEYEPGDWCPR